MADIGSENNEELAFLKNWIDFVLGRLLPKEDPTHKEVKHAIQRAFEEQDLRGLRVAAKEMGQMAKSLPEGEYAFLNQEVKSKFGRPLKTSSLSKVRKILASGKIKNRSEYEIMSQYVEDNYADESKKQEIEDVNKLLVGHDKYGFRDDTLGNHSKSGSEV